MLLAPHKPLGVVWGLVVSCERQACRRHATILGSHRKRGKCGKWCDSLRVPIFLLIFVAQTKEVIRPRFTVEPRVLMFGSYSKGYANPDSDIDVAVIVPTYGDSKLEISKGLWRDTRQVSFLIEPVLMAEDRWSPLYEDVMRTGIVV